MRIEIGSFEQKANSIMLIFFYTSILIITGLTYYLQKSAEIDKMIFPVDNIVQYLNL